MKRLTFALGVVVCLAVLATSDKALAQSTVGLHLFESKCASCHQSAQNQKAPDASVLRKMKTEAVYAALSKAPHTQIQKLSDDDKKTVAAYLGGLKLGIAEIADAKKMPNQCTADPPMKDIDAASSWNGWGADPMTNARFQPASAAGLAPGQVPNLKLKWAFGFPLAEEAHGQPTIAGGRIFVGSDAGTVYSLDAKSGCVYWSYQADGAMRVAPTVAPAKGMGSAKYVVYAGDQKANAFALDADTGKLLWKTKIDDHPVAQITGAPTLYEGKLFVPMASAEERSAGQSFTYPCCTFRGSVTALDAKSGKQIWKTYIIPDPPKPTKKSAKGIQHFGPAGGAVWAAPTVDTKHNAIYIGTGDAYTLPTPKNTDAVMALDMSTGKVLWSVQDTENDSWLSGCGNGGTNNPDGISENCPDPLGPDFDFGSSMILKALPDGHRVLIAAQKSGMVWAHDPDQQGKLLWKVQLVDKLALGMITFGGAADDQNAYFGLRSGGIAAVDLKTGAKKWFTPLPGQKTAGQWEGQTAALTVIPGVVFSGGWDGMLRAFSTTDGKEIWEFNTHRDFQTLNGIKANGGTMASAGPTIVGGMLYVGSGYQFGTGYPGNVLLAFSAQ
ncbi:MAG TPA: PQQ-binding-like beta-propeller repeat protein [Candidatus Acidoferrales bacterium]|nr:PQQ-binding-like beta-propeller repeat protein [Candidatus Acidoferrales bacterium]